MMLAAMLTILMIQLQSFSRLVLVLLTAPLGTDRRRRWRCNVAAMPFGFVALLGLIALAGMIMRNTVILVDQIESDARGGHRDRRTAIVEAAVRRARPVVLTALAADPGDDPAVTLAPSGVRWRCHHGRADRRDLLTLLFVPALYALWNRRRLREEDDLKSRSRLLCPSPGPGAEGRAKVDGNSSKRPPNDAIAGRSLMI